MTIKKCYSRKWPAFSLISTCVMFGTFATAQTMPVQNPTDDRDTSRRELASFDRFLDSHSEIAEQLRKDPSLVNNQQFLKDHSALQTYLQSHPQVTEEIKENPTIFMQQEARYETTEKNRPEVASFDRFLDSHRETAEQLRKNPSLVDNQQFLKDHPALQTYLQDHPQVRQEIRENPTTFMQQEARFDASENNRDRDTTRRELASFDRFLDSHRDTAEQLRKDPSLVNNQQFLKDHSALQTYLQSHPQVTEEIKENPTIFMQQEARYETTENNHPELASFDQFLDSHHEISEQLRKQPSLADNKQFLKDHPALQSYLQQHPGVREQLAQNPNAFMSQEARYERSGDDRNMDRHTSYDRERNNNAYNRDRDNRKDLDRNNGMGQHDRDMDQDRDAHRHFGEFLGSHQDIAKQLSRNPSLAKDHDYLQNHPELQEYLNAHPEVRKPLTSDPASFVKSAQQFNGQDGQTTKMPAPTSTQPKPKQ